MTQHTPLPVESVQERDIDLLLVEEFLSSDSFIDFFTDTLDLPHCDKLLNVQRSIHDFDLGETDVLVEYAHRDRTIALLIENKLDAAFQPDQAVRYETRASHYRDAGKYDAAYTILVAPAQYIERQHDFSNCVSYEQIADYFRNAGLEKRGDYKVTLLKIASEKLRRGYTAINSEHNQAFWRDYHAQLALNAPEIFMKPVTIVPAKSDWIELEMGAVRVTHKLAKGQLDFAGLSADQQACLIERFGEVATRISFKSGDVVRVSTEVLDRMSPFTDQQKSFRKCVACLQIARETLEHDTRK